MIVNKIVSSKIKCLVIIFIVGGFLSSHTQDTIAQEKKGEKKGEEVGPTQFIPIFTYRTGPFADIGSGVPNGLSDYFKLINNRDGGVNGVKLVFEECEYSYNSKKGMECYHNFAEKYGKDNLTALQPFSTGVVKKLHELAIKGELKVPIVAQGYAYDAVGTGIIPNSFQFGTNYTNAAARKIAYIAELEGKKNQNFFSKLFKKKNTLEIDTKSLKGLTIVNSHLHVPYGYETRAILDLLAKKYDFKVVHIANKWPAIDQTETFEQIKKLNPDYVINRQWGAACYTLYTHAKEIGFPADKIINVHWCGQEETMLNAGDVSKGAIAIEFSRSTRKAPIHDELRKHVLQRMQGTGSTTLVGTAAYNRGLVSAMYIVEAIKIAQDHFNKKGQSVTAEEMVYAFQNFNLSTEKLEALGMDQLTGPFSTSCGNQGKISSPLEVKQWNGTSFDVVSGRKLYFQEEVAQVISEKSDAMAEKLGLKEPECK